MTPLITALVGPWLVNCPLLSPTTVIQRLLQPSSGLTLSPACSITYYYMIIFNYLSCLEFPQLEKNGNNLVIDQVDYGVETCWGLGTGLGAGKLVSLKQPLPQGACCLVWGRRGTGKQIWCMKTSQKKGPLNQVPNSKLELDKETPSTIWLILRILGIVATAKKSFSKLKLIHIYLNSTRFKEKVSALVSLTSELNSASKLNYCAAGESLRAARCRGKIHLH